MRLLFCLVDANIFFSICQIIDDIVHISQEFIDEKRQ